MIESLVVGKFTPDFVSVIKSGSVGFELFGLFVCLFDSLNCFPWKY